MLKSKYIERICCIVMALSVLLTCGVLGAVQAGMIEISTAMGYENRLFDQSRVHTIDIVMDDWDSFIDTCENEEYAAAALVIDGESYKNVAIRAKGNTSLSSVAQYGNDRYSFKVEFDHYDSSITYHGLDKLSLNNIIQDATYMKDYLAYTLMNKMGVASPLCSYVQINVNGEPWGFYLAVEGVEDAFLARNYGSDAGELYKPDSMSFGGGRGNGRGFDMEDFDFEAIGDGADMPQMPDMTDMPQMPEGGGFPGGMDFGSFDFSSGTKSGERPSDERSSGERGQKGRGGFGGMGSSDVKLQYIDDDPASYENIFSNAKTDVTEADQTRLIASLKALGEGDTSVVDTEQVMRYLAVHHFLCNDDSYTGQMVHNYYLRENDGVLSLIPWDYNLSFGGFGGGGGRFDSGSSGATSTVNSPIDSPVSSGDVSDRPMIAWIWNSTESTAAYHAIYQEFLDTVFHSGWFAEELERVIALIAPYVQADVNGFFTYEEFQTATDTLRIFCEKRVQSLTGQLAGTIPSTSEGQRTSDALIDASEISISDMGGMNAGRMERPGNAAEMSDGAFQKPEGFDRPGEIPAMPGSSDGSAAPPENPSMTEGSGRATADRIPGNAPTAASAESAAPVRESRKAAFPENTTAGTAASWPWLLGCVAFLALGVAVASRWKGNM